MCASDAIAEIVLVVRTIAFFIACSLSSLPGWMVVREAILGDKVANAVGARDAFTKGTQATTVVSNRLCKTS